VFPEVLGTQKSPWVPPDLASSHGWSGCWAACFDRRSAARRGRGSASAQGAAEDAEFNMVSHDPIVSHDPTTVVAMAGATP